MNINIFAGKGGVGKTSCAVSFARALSKLRKGQKIGIVDYDGGHSVTTTLGLTIELTPNTVHKVAENIFVAVVENTKYTGVLEAQEKQIGMDAYFNQFPGDSGVMPLADMVTAFFGIPTDTATLQKFTRLVYLILEMDSQGVETIVIDVEPTAGLETMLSNADSIARSLRNLQNKGIVFLTFIAAKWPDIAKYLKGSYIKSADVFTARIEKVASYLKSAHFVIVATGEISPIRQTFSVKEIIENFGGKVHGYVLNNLRGELYEEENCKLITRQGLPVVKIRREESLHSGDDKTTILEKIGSEIVSQFNF